MSLFVCLDCGGSKTSAVICDASGTVKGRALGGPSNFAYLGVDAFTTAIHQAVSDALKTCVSPPSVDPVPLPPSKPLFAAAWLGVSGADSKAVVDSISHAMSKLLDIPEGKRLIVANDAHLLAAPLQVHDDVFSAVTCIAGTGSIVISFTQDPITGELKEMGRTGGWGWILGDQGGGFHAGREAVRQIITRADVASVEGPLDIPPEKNTLEKMVLKEFGLPETDVYELLAAVHLPDPVQGAIFAPGTPGYAHYAREKRLSRLAPLVFKAAFEDGDPLALNVLDVTSKELVDQISLMSRPGALRRVDPGQSVLCFGGSLVGVAKYRDLVLGKLAERGIVFKRWEFVDDAAAVGARGLA
ncbi:hypothetical protein BDY19DRAFT_858224, partial [Irpex rosettiformis]